MLYNPLSTLAFYPARSDGGAPPCYAFTISAGTYFSDIKNSFLFLFEVRKIASAIITILPSRLSALFSYNPVIFANKKNRVIRFQPTVPRSLWEGAEAICYFAVAPSGSLKVGALATDAYGHESALKPLVLSERQLLYQLKNKSRYRAVARSSIQRDFKAEPYFAFFF